jgi:hypothetical protein
MSSTRLLVLGAVRILEPVHGCFVRRELLTWRVEQWATINAGSIYNALGTLGTRTFERESGWAERGEARLLATWRSPGVIRGPSGRRPAPY